MKDILTNDFVDKVEGNLNKQSAITSSVNNIINNKSLLTQHTMHTHLNNSNINTGTTNSNASNLDALKALRRTIVQDKELVKEIIININNFYIDDNPTYGISYKEDIANVISNTNDKGFEGLVNLFHYLSIRKRFRLSSLLKDKLSNPYYWAEVSDGMSDIGFKIPYFEGVDKMLKGNNNFKYNISMEEILNSLNS